MEGQPLYDNSVQRIFTRQSIISNLKPTKLFIKLDFTNRENEDLKVREITTELLKFNIDGLVLKSGSRESLVELAKSVRKIDVNNKLILVSAGCDG